MVKKWHTALISLMCQLLRHRKFGLKNFFTELKRNEQSSNAAWPITANLYISEVCPTSSVTF